MDQKQSNINECNRHGILSYMAKLIMLSLFTEKIDIFSTAPVITPFMDNATDYELERALRKMEFKNAIQAFIKSLSRDIKIPEDTLTFFYDVQDRTKYDIPGKNNKKGWYTMDLVPVMNKYPELFVVDNKFPNGKCFKQKRIAL